MYTALIPPSRRRVSPIPKLPIARKSSKLVRRGTRHVIPTSPSSTPATRQQQQQVGIPQQTLEQILQMYERQQEQLAMLQQALVEYKRDTSKTLNVDLHDRFEGISKHEVMTQYACKWFGILMVGHLIFFYIYFFVRQSSRDDEDEDDDEVSTAREQAREGLMEVTVYSFSYLFIVIFDIFWMTIFPDKIRCERTTDKTHVIVAAHRAHESLEVMLPTVFRTFSPHCVWVADNGFPDKEAEELCKRLGVNYEYNPHPNKANALVVVARKIKRQFGDAVENVVLLDDDTELAEDFFIRHDLLEDPRVGGYCVGIAINRSPPFNIWEVAIDFEYRAISYAFGSRATCSTLPFCHGICAVYKLDLMIEMYSKNWTLPGGLPFGEDGYAGLLYRKAGFKLLQDNANVVLTYCPRRFFPPMRGGRVQGYGASSLWKQRGMRWFLSWPRQLSSEFWLFFTYPAGSWYGNIQYRIYVMWWLFLNCVSVAWIPYMFYVWYKHESWIFVLLLKGMLAFTGILVAILRILVFPKTLRRGLHPLVPLCSPILGMANSILRFVGFVYSLYWFIPFYQINKLRVLGDDDDGDDEEDGGDNTFLIERGDHTNIISYSYDREVPTTEQSPETHDYYESILVEEDNTNTSSVRISWSDLLSDTSNNNTVVPSSSSGTPLRHTRFEI